MAFQILFHYPWLIELVDFVVIQTWYSFQVIENKCESAYALMSV